MSRGGVQLAGGGRDLFLARRGRGVPHCDALLARGWPGARHVPRCAGRFRTGALELDRFGEGVLFCVLRGLLSDLCSVCFVSALVCRGPCVLDLCFYELSLLFWHLALAVSRRSSTEFATRVHCWSARSELDAHITAFNPPAWDAVADAEASPPESRVSRLFGCCVRRRVRPISRSRSQLMIFVTKEDLLKMSFPGLRSEEEAADAFARWREGVAP